MKRINNSEDGCEEEEGSISNIAERYECEKNSIFRTKNPSTAMEPYESCTHLKYKKLYNAVLLINPGGGEIFRPSRPALRPTQPPVQWVPGFSRE